MDKKELLDWARFVATKFSVNEAGWVYSRNLGTLKHIRYEGDYTGYNHWTKRVARAFSPKRLLGLDSLSRQFNPKFKNRGLKDIYYSALANIVVHLRKDNNLPDGQINGIITQWEEDGEYIMFFGPTVGVKVLDFIEAEPENPHALAIVSEMERMAKLSFDKKEPEDESD